MAITLAATTAALFQYTPSCPPSPNTTKEEEVVSADVTSELGTHSCPREH